METKRLDLYGLPGELWEWYKQQAKNTERSTNKMIIHALIEYRKLIESRKSDETNL